MLLTILQYFLKIYPKNLFLFQTLLHYRKPCVQRGFFFVLKLKTLGTPLDRSLLQELCSRQHICAGLPVGLKCNR
ncbi:putative exonuclease [Escherichia phage ESCO13] [Escherichia phage vB_Eco_PATM]|nr:putative exonuclease [Escherichia phage ESCO13] [Escherichia phage vB_Eco_PATM]